MMPRGNATTRFRQDPRYDQLTEISLHFVLAKRGSINQGFVDVEPGAQSFASKFHLRRYARYHRTCSPDPNLAMTSEIRISAVAVDLEPRWLLAFLLLRA